MLSMSVVSVKEAGSKYSSYFRFKKESSNTYTILYCHSRIIVQKVRRPGLSCLSASVFKQQVYCLATIPAAASILWPDYPLL
jgi:prolipoprotein diacylglyceryltransferase